jgi:hypothetical protein
VAARKRKKKNRRKIIWEIRLTVFNMCPSYYLSPISLSPFHGKGESGGEVP